MAEVYFLAGKSEYGRNYYRCYRGVDSIAESEVAPYGRVRPVHIRGAEKEMDCLVDKDLTIFPGVEYSIRLSGAAEPIRVIYVDRGWHRMVCGKMELTVRGRGSGKYKFFLGGKHLASMVSVGLTDPEIPLGDREWTPRYTMMSRVELPGILAALMLHFPMLQIGL